MAPKRNSHCSASASRTSVNRSMTKMMTQLSPYPKTVQPSLDPPSIRVNPVKPIVLQFNTLDLVDPDRILALDLANFITKATGLTAFAYVIKYVHVWAEGGSTVELSLTDSGTKIKTTDNGSFSQRARCGLAYSKNIQTVNTDATSSKNIAEISSSGTGAVVHVGCNYWATPAVPAVGAK